MDLEKAKIELTNNALEIMSHLNIVSGRVIIDINKAYNRAVPSVEVVKKKGSHTIITKFDI